MLQRCQLMFIAAPESSPPRAINGDERVSDENFRNYERNARQSRDHGKPKLISAKQVKIASDLYRNSTKRALQPVS